MRSGILVASCLLTVSFVSAASVEVQVGDRTYYVDTGTADGRCKTHDIGEASEETICRDGSNVAAVSTKAGCLDSSGAGYCAADVRKWPGAAGSQLTCADRRAFFLLVGSEATCRLSGSGKTCSAPTGSSATADCVDGCGDTAGAGGCCQAGTGGCPTTRAGR